MRNAASVLGAVALLMGSAAPAGADDIFNNLDGSIDASAESVTVSSAAPGNTATVSLAVNPMGGDGKSGCNLTGSTTATFSVTSSNTAFATVAPSSVTFTSCGATQSVTVTGVAAGEATVSLTQTANTTSGTFDTAPATFLVHVTAPCPSAPAAPTVAVTPAAASSGWYNIATGAPTASISPAAATPATTQQYSLDGGSFVTGDSVTVPTDGVHTLSARSVIPASGSCAQVNGAATTPVTLRVDRTAPSYTVSVPAATGLLGWDTSDVAVTYTCSDATSGLAATCPTNATYTDGQTATQTTTAIFDVAGNQSANQTRRAIKVDETKPTVTSDVPPAPASGWDTAGFTVTYTCDDPAPSGGGVVSGIPSGACPAAELLTESGSPYGVRSVTVTDAAGNTSDSYTRRAVQIDGTVPTASVVVAPNANAAGWNNSTVTATYTCSDNVGGSGLSTPCPATETFTVDGITAAKTFTVQDNAGNESDPATRREVKVDLSAPQVSVAFQDAGGNALTMTNGWYTEDVHVVFTCGDAAVNGVASGVQTAAAYACPSSYWVNTEGTTPASDYQIRDNADNATSGTVPAIKLDKTAPVLAAVVVPVAANDFGWNNITVTVDWTCTETGSGLASSCPTDESYGDGSDVTARTGVTVADVAGHVSNAVDVRAIRVDTQLPTISVSLTDGDGTVITPTSGWFNQTVWVRFTCADQGTSGLRDAETPFACPPDYSLSEGHHGGYLASIKDKADNGASASVPAIDIDMTAPQATVHYYAAGTTTEIAPNGFGWFNQDVTVHVDCTDPTSNGVASGVNVSTCPADVTHGEGAFASSAFTLADRAGNTVGGSVDALSIDKSDPTIGYVLRDTLSSTPVTPNSHGWFKSSVTVDFTCGDTGGSGLDDSVGALNPCPTDLGLAEGQYPATTAYVDDKAGNQGSVAVEAINIDTTAPDVPTFDGGPTDGGLYFPTTVPAVPTCSSGDGLSGLDSCVVTGYSTAVGSHTLTATAADLAGNTSTATLTYNVYTLTLNGFFQPVDMNGIVNTVKGGSTVPLKFRVFDQGVERTDTAVVKTFGAKTYTCGTTAPEDAVEMTTTGGTLLRYDTTGTQFIQNWQTPKAAGSCYVATVTFVDGSKVSAYFKLK